MPVTKKLYYEDSFLFQFDACVLACELKGDVWAVVLDRTAFYPEGGGQPADTGTLGEARVLDVHEAGGSIAHTTDAPLPVGMRVEGRVDARRRLDHMQQHTGEHILSGLLHSLYGADNVGFHIGPDTVRMDMSLELTAQQLADAELAANQVVWQDVPVQCAWPGPEQLADAEYRSKKVLDGPVRLVTVPGADCCACCGTHLYTTGQVGAIKILSSQNYKGGVRLTVACGGRALADHAQKCTAAAEISAALSFLRGRFGW